MAPDQGKGSGVRGPAVAVAAAVADDSKRCCSLILNPNTWISVFGVRIKIQFRTFSARSGCGGDGDVGPRYLCRSSD